MIPQQILGIFQCHCRGKLFRLKQPFIKVSSHLKRIFKNRKMLDSCSMRTTSSFRYATNLELRTHTHETIVSMSIEFR